MVVIGLVFAVPATSEARACGSLRASGNWGEVTVTVNTRLGDVGCREARNVARRLFSGQGCWQDNGTSANSYWRVGKWRGYARMGGWELTHPERRAKIGGRIRYRGDNDKTAREC